MHDWRKDYDIKKYLAENEKVFKHARKAWDPMGRTLRPSHMTKTFNGTKNTSTGTEQWWEIPVKYKSMRSMKWSLQESGKHNRIHQFHSPKWKEKFVVKYGDTEAQLLQPSATYTGALERLSVKTHWEMQQYFLTLNGHGFHWWIEIPEENEDEPLFVSSRITQAPGDAIWPS